ncbi:hypothetical protein FRB90_003880 [Tulasnella sp. 427]|nr:hypothetical protein FRB90_003880 [Tulasnella sp. 427]
MSTSNSSTALTLTFPDYPFSGRVNDSPGTTLYLLSTDKGSLGGMKETFIDHVGPGGASERVAVIHWPKGMEVNVRGRDCGALVTLKRNEEEMFSLPEYWFTVEGGKELHWKNNEASLFTVYAPRSRPKTNGSLQCFTASGERVATYSEELKRLLHSNIPAGLSVEQGYSEPPVLEYILVSALIVERDRRATVGAATAAASAGAAGIPIGVF